MDTKPGFKPQLPDFIALIGGLLIVVGYIFLPLASNYPGITGAAFTDQRATFLILTFACGTVAVMSFLVSGAALQERAVRWWFAGLGVLGLLLFIDNALLADRFLTRNVTRSVGIWKLVLDSGGLLMLAGCGLLVAQAALPRRAAAVSAASRSSDTILGLVRMMIAVLWLSQLLWKLPWANYGCPAGALVPAADTSGLCDWIGREIREPRYGFYESFLTGFVSPNLGWMAFFIVAGEAFIAFSLLTGTFTRMGALAGLGMGINLFIGLTAVRNPFEWDWTYLMLPAINAVFVAVGGRWVGLDALINRPLAAMVANKRGGLPVRLLAWLTS
jgi:hypothetical protein